jgi:hypothetical protein
MPENHAITVSVSVSKEYIPHGCVHLGGHPREILGGAPHFIRSMYNPCRGNLHPMRQ